MSARRVRRVAAAAAAVGGCMGLVALLAPTAGAGSRSLDIYDSQGIGEGIIFDFTIEPSIFTPLVHAGIGYAQATLGSQGGGSSYALAAPVFPSTFAIGAVGCGGLPGWVQAYYPAAGDCQSDVRFSLVEGGVPSNQDALLTVKGGTLMHARAGFGQVMALSTAGGLTLTSDPKAPPFLEVAELHTINEGRRTPTLVEQTVTTTVKGLRLTAGGVRLVVDGLVSKATSRSDGAAGAADATMTIGDTTVEVGGSSYDAWIDSEGIHVRAPSLDRDERAVIDHTIAAALDAAGVTITISTPVEIVEGEAAEASVGGLVIAMVATVPSARIPPEITPVIGPVFEQIPTVCLYELPPLPGLLNQLRATLCFGRGVLPGPGSPMRATVNVASVSATSVGLEGFSFDPGPPASFGDGDFVTPVAAERRPAGDTRPPSACLRARRADAVRRARRGRCGIPPPGRRPHPRPRPAQMTPEDESPPPAKPQNGAALRGSWRLAAAALLLVCGIVFVLLGWYGAAHTNILTEQIPYLISGGLMGLGLIVVAGFLASSASLEQETRELRREIARALEGGTLRTGPVAVPAGPVSADGQVFALPGGHSYHVAGCPILEGKEGVRSLVAAEATASGLAPCKLCGPD